MLKSRIMQPIFTVSELNNAVRGLLENEFALIHVQGEISNFIRPASGHWYFTLKDAQAQIRCAMFRGANAMLRFKPEDGMQVTAHAKVSLYAPRGDYQLIVEFLEATGDGLLLQQFERLKKKLEQEGLFQLDHKKSLPEVPRAIGVVTSSTGAAIRDIIKVLHRRCPYIPIIIYPTLVQGDKAAATISAMIEIANQRAECDVLIVGRGGGSLEDLWPFNEEVVARAIYNSAIPIISAVGHETDVTIADFVADVRAPTPSAAAEIASPDSREFHTRLATNVETLIYHWESLLEAKQQQLEYLSKRLRHPRDKLQEQSQQLDYLWQSLIKAQEKCFNQKQRYLAELSRTLNAVSPLATLGRGYAILQQDIQVIQSIDEVKLDQELHARLHDGTLTCQIKHIKHT